jgi:hypothetical protein
MEISFRHNGQLYNQCFAWFPRQVTSGAWVWMSVYYTTEVKGQGWASFTPFEFMLLSAEDKK